MFGSAARAFAYPKDAEVLLGASSDDRKPFGIAELVPSPEIERVKRNNPHECSVKKGSLRALSSLPADWRIDVSGPVSARRVAASAKDAIEAQLESGLENLLKRHNEDVMIALARIEESEAKARRAVDDTDLLRQKQTEEEQVLEDLKRLNVTTQAAHNQKVVALEEEMLKMEERLRDLRDMLSQKGERLVALELLDQADLDRLLPVNQAVDTRGRPSLGEVLNGDFSRLAPFIQARLWNRNIIFSQAQIRNFLALLRTSDLTILAGDSGSGKTSMVKAVAESIGGRCAVIAVKPNWTGPEDLLGYYNPIERSYQSTPFLQALLAAAEEPDVPHLILLDEMNLARVEHYFADFLSLLETRDHSPEIPLFTSDEARHVVVENGLFLGIEEEARLHAGLGDATTLKQLLKDDAANDRLQRVGGFKNTESVLLHHARLRRALAALLRIPTSLTFPSNVRIIGAVNMDETTFSLSPKVLDRCHVVKFGNPLLAEWETLEDEVETFDPAQLATPVFLNAADLGERKDYPSFDRSDVDCARLAEIAKEFLDPLGIEFGLRAIRQARGYLDAARVAGIDEVTAFNNVILQKVLPKILLDVDRIGRDGRKMGQILEDLRARLDQLIDRGALADGSGDCIEQLDALIASADRSNGIASYWSRY